MNEKLIFYKIIRLENKIDELEKKIDKLLKVCGRMNNHISFVERVYETLRLPISYITNRFSISN